ncbi:OadG family transporter subunit [Phocaeicola plebeius]|jgi:Na+-transporting methylmalonyl-CoA/oxaloacetate decarboxylase gamma subunit|uniref:OadG family transporter subunit n=1 Tax=Phocaeicola plebeius TaxID=310297 RepID=UPI0026EF8FDF|nr:OadG family transporter subunit [Phocaeicola plebeius]
MNKYIAGIFFASAMVGALSSCTAPDTGSKIVINEVLVDNQDNFQDDYGVHSGWVEIFNTSYNSVNLAGCYLKVSSEPGDTLSYFIPKGDVLTAISPRQHALFWADGAPRRGTFHTNFVLSKTRDNWVGLYDSGRKLLDEVVVPAGVLKTDQSYARVSDGADQWEVKDDSETKYVTPSTNNQTLEGNPKMDKFEQHDSAGLGMTITAMTVVFTGLILLYLCFRIIGKVAVKLRKRNAMKAQNVTDKQEAKERGLGEAPGEVIAAISMALHEAQGADHDVEETILTISRVKRSYSPWSSKIYTLRETPHKK